MSAVFEAIRPSLVGHGLSAVQIIEILQRASATKLQSWIASFGGDGIGLLRALKFDQVGFHPRWTATR